MKKTLLSIKRVNSAEKWYVCTGIILGKKVNGFGTTMLNAIQDAYRDYKVIMKLK